MEQLEKTLEKTGQNACSGGCCGAAGENQVEKAPQAEAESRNESARAYVPAVDIIDNENDTLLLIDLPGVEESEVELSLEKNILTIHAKPAPFELADRTLTYSEYGVGDYRRSFSLSNEVNREGISASLKDGVLKIKLPKTAPVSRKIAIAGD